MLEMINVGSSDNTVFAAKFLRVRSQLHPGVWTTRWEVSCFHELLYFWHSVISLHWCKEYLTAIKF